MLGKVFVQLMLNHAHSVTSGFIEYLDGVWIIRKIIQYHHLVVWSSRFNMSVQLLDKLKKLNCLIMTSNKITYFHDAVGVIFLNFGSVIATFFSNTGKCLLSTSINSFPASSRLYFSVF